LVTCLCPQACEPDALLLGDPACFCVPIKGPVGYPGEVDVPAFAATLRNQGIEVLSCWINNAAGCCTQLLLMPVRCQANGVSCMRTGYFMYCVNNIPVSDCGQKASKPAIPSARFVCRPSCAGPDPNREVWAQCCGCGVRGLRRGRPSHGVSCLDDVLASFPSLRVAGRQPSRHLASGQHCDEACLSTSWLHLGVRGASRGFASGGEPAELELLMLVFRECPKKVSACPPAGLLMLG
jgi:hypothetical protein